MLEIRVPETEWYDESTNEFNTIKSQALRLEHSLVSISKWEAKWEKPYLSKEKKTNEEILDYIRCMTLTQNVDPRIYLCIPEHELERVAAYLDSKQTATTIRRPPSRPGPAPIITSEVIYHMMITYNIPIEFQKWHINRLLTLIQVCDIKSGNGPKMTRKEVIETNKAINEANRKKFQTKG